MNWRKSSYSGNGNCVEVALLPSGQIAIRDSTNPSGPTLVVTQSDWRKFIHRMRTAATSDS
ncbi:MAG: DUF397 domain-containing protein [Actinomycetes bacterium]|jgi:hypothetical protein|nr:MAG: DUF397 domain-containing protein [Actinomycetota bacterium]